MEETEGKEANDLAKLLSLMDGQFVPVIPDEVTEYYLRKTGFNCPDKRITRIISLSAQKLMRDISNESIKFCMRRQQGSKAQNKNLTLTLEDLSYALAEYGITIRKPDYFADSTNEQ